jgi:hypothetical protein
MSNPTLGKITNYFSLEISLELDFCIDGARIYTTDTLPNQTEMPKEADTDIKDYLVIEAWARLDTIDPVSEVNRYTRPTILTLLSIISYLLDYPLTVYDATFSVAESAPDEKPDKIEVSEFTHDQIDRSSDLYKILEAIYLNEDEDVNPFVAPALARWHKARYLEKLSDADLYDAESFLAYFHIMELFANHFSNKLPKKNIGLFAQFYCLMGKFRLYQEYVIP